MEGERIAVRASSEARAPRVEGAQQDSRPHGAVGLGIVEAASGGGAEPPPNPTKILSLQRTAGNRAVTELLRGQGTRPVSWVQRAPVKPATGSQTATPAADQAVDVVEAIVHMMSNAGLSGDVGQGGENISSPLYAPDVLGTVREKNHKELIMWWYQLATETINNVKVEQLHKMTAPLLDQMKADKAAGSRARKLVTQYADGLDRLLQRQAARDVTSMIDVGVAKEKAIEADPRAKPTSDEAMAITAVSEAQKVLAKWVGAYSALLRNTTSSKAAEAMEIELKRIERSFINDKMAGIDPEIRWPGTKRGLGMNGVDFIVLLQGGVDAASAILAVADPDARKKLFESKSNTFGKIAQGASIAQVLTKFASGAITAAGGGAYAILKVMGKASTAEGILDLTTKTIGNVGAVISLAGVIHGAFAFADPKATTAEKAEAAVEFTSSSLSVLGFASKWVPRLAKLARWSGPIGTSLQINFTQFTYLAHVAGSAKAGMDRLDWTQQYRDIKAAAIEVQDWQRRLAVVNALLAVETDSRRKEELEKNAKGFRDELVNRQLVPFVTGRGSSKEIGAFATRMEGIKPLLEAAHGSDDAAMAASSAFLHAVAKALREWDTIVAESNRQ